ncbi:hypothetical protein Plhal703r1_c17g0079941 [Plasmopara halstedii]
MRNSSKVIFCTLACFLSEPKLVPHGVFGSADALAKEISEAIFALGVSGRVAHEEFARHIY